MMKIITIDPRAELVIRSVNINSKEDASRLKDFIRQDTIERGELDRILISEGTTQILEPGDPIPVPLPAGKVLR